MQQPTRLLQSNLTQVVVWCVATPVLTGWFLISLLPVASLIGNWGDPLAALIALAFLGTGAVGVLAGAVGYRLLLWKQPSMQIVSSETRTRRALWLSIYASIWLVLYGLYAMN